MKPLRLALIGSGGIAERHLDAADEHPDAVRFVAACDPDPEAIARVRDRIPGIRTCADVGQLVGTGGFDAAVVATPHFLHFEQAAAVARAGCGVLVEKPLVTTTEQMRRLRDIAEASGATVLAGQTRRFAPDIVRARDFIRSERDFGALRSFDIQSLQDIRSFIPDGAAHWLLDGDLAGGGVAISNAIHQIDMVRFLTGADYTAVMARADREPPFINGAECRVSAVMELSDGSHGTLHADYLATRSPFSEAMTLVGEHGSVAQHAEHLGQYRGPLTCATSGGVRSTRFSQQHDGWHAVDDRPERPQESFTRQLLHFAAVLRGQESPLSSLADNFNTIACVEALTVSAQSGRRVEVATW